MQKRIDLRVPSSKEWIDCVLSDFDEFLKDHADCERKASSMAMSFVAKYPDRIEIIPELIATGIEELEHFDQVCQLLLKRSIPLPHKIMPDPYVNMLIKKAHSGREERFLDKLLIASIVETRGAERFRMVADGLVDEELKEFYKNLWISEARHGEMFVRMAIKYFPEDKTLNRLNWWGYQEAEILESLSIRPALH